MYTNTSRRGIQPRPHSRAKGEKLLRGSRTPITPTALKEAAADGTPRSGSPEVREIVEDVIADIRTRADVTVREYSEELDNWAPESFLLSDEKIREAIARLPRPTGRTPSDSGLSAIAGVRRRRNR